MPNVIQPYKNHWRVARPPWFKEIQRELTQSTISSVKKRSMPCNGGWRKLPCAPRLLMKMNPWHNLLSDPLSQSAYGLQQMVSDHCGIKMLYNYEPPDARRLPPAKDMIVIGRPTWWVCQETFSLWNQPSIAWDQSKQVPGGSSSGSAAAVASGQRSVCPCPDNGGSIQQPAAFNGIVGLKPYGTVSRLVSLPLVAHFWPGLDLSSNGYLPLLNVIASEDIMIKHSAPVRSDYSKIGHIKDEDCSFRRNTRGRDWTQKSKKPS